MYTYIMKMKMVRWKVNCSMSICTPVRSYNNKGEGGWKSTYKLALLQLVENEKILSKEIMREQLMNLKRRAGGFGS